MAKITGTRIPAGGGAANPHSGKGAVYAIIATTDQATSQAVTFYDNTAASGTVLIKFWVLDVQPFTFHFHESFPLRFATGLTVDPGSCEVYIGAVGN